MITYKVTNTKNKKWYVGSAINFEKRKNQHLNSKQKTPFHNALRKSPESFIWEILEEDSLNIRDKEQFILDQYFGSEECYNLSPSAGGFTSKMAREASLSRTEWGKKQGGTKSGPKVGKMVHEKYPEKMKENGKKTLKLLIERNPNHQSDAGKIGGKQGSREKKRLGGLKCKELKIGIFSLSPEQKSEISRVNMCKINSQLWCDPEHPELGVHSAGTLASMQKGGDFYGGKKIERG